MIPGQFATHRGRTVQVLNIQGGQTRGFGSLRTPQVFTLKPYPEGETYTVTDPGPDLTACDTPDGYQPPVVSARPVEPRFYSSGRAW